MQSVAAAAEEAKAAIERRQLVQIFTSQITELKEKI